MRVILTGFEPLSEGKSAYLSCFCRRTGAKQIRSAGGAAAARRKEEPEDERGERGRKKRERFQGAASSTRTGRVFLFVYSRYIFIFALWLKKKSSFSAIMGFQSTFVLSFMCRLRVEVVSLPKREGNHGELHYFSWNTSTSVNYVFFFFPRLAKGSRVKPPLMFM